MSTRPDDNPLATRDEVERALLALAAPLSAAASAGATLSVEENPERFSGGN